MNIANCGFVLFSTRVTAVQVSVRLLLS